MSQQFAYTPLRIFQRLYLGDDDAEMSFVNHISVITHKFTANLAQGPYQSGG